MLPWIARGILLLIGVGVGAGIWAKDAYFSPQATIWRECGRGESDQGRLRLDSDCFADHMERLTNERGVQGALAVLAKVGERTSSGECHFGAHMVGWAAFKKHGSPAAAFEEFTQEGVCTSGYYHGVVEEFLEDRNGESLADVVDEVCAAPAGTRVATSQGQWQCTHGFGHVVMALSDYDLPSALSVCDKFTTENQRYGCGYGVFMENWLAGHFREGVVSPWAKPSEPLFPCFENEVSAEYQKPCLEWAPSFIVKYQTKDALETFRTCTSLPQDFQKEYCYKGMAREIATTLDGSPEQIVTWCTSIPDAFQSECLRQTMLNYTTTRDRMPRGVALCAVVPDALREECGGWFGGRVGGTIADRGDRKRWCDALSAGRDRCYERAGLTSSL